MSNPLHKINVCNRSASLIFKTRQVEDRSLQNILNSAESKFGLINLCFQLSSTFHIELMPAPHRRGEGHSHVENCTERPVASVKSLACKFSLPPFLLPQVLTLTTSHQTTWPDPSCEKIEQNIAQNSGLSTTWTAAMLLLEPQTDSSALASNCLTNLSCFFKILENMN